MLRGVLGASGWKRTRHIIAALLVLSVWIHYSPAAQKKKKKSRAKRDATKSLANGADGERGRWELHSDLRAAPAARGGLLRLVGEAARLSYEVPAGYYHKAGGALGDIHIGGHSAKQTWRRLPEAEELSEAGLSAIALREDVTKRAIVAYRGECFDSTDDRCMLDFCAGWFLNGGNYIWALVSDWKDLYGAVYCRWTWGGRDIDYLTPAARVASKVMGDLPGYAVLLTGHSLGGVLAVAVAAKLGLQAVALAAPRVDLALRAEGLDPANIGAADVWSVYHEWDPVYQDILEVGELSLAAVGTCLFGRDQRVPLPAACKKCAARYELSACKQECFRTHLLGHYLALLSRTNRPNDSFDLDCVAAREAEPGASGGRRAEGAEL